MKKALLIILAVVVLGIAGFCALIVSTGKELRPLAEKILVDCREGRVEDVYGNASEAFRQEETLERFAAYIASRRRTLGPFQRIVKTVGAGKSTSTGQGTRGNVNLELAYERANTRGEFTFVKEDGEWKLLGLKIFLPEDLTSEGDRGLLEPLSRELLDLFEQEKYVALYERFPPELKAEWPAEKFEADMRGFRARAGGVRDATLESIRDFEGIYVAVTFRVNFERAPGQYWLKFLWQGEEWTVFGFSLDLDG
ncbi:MAG: hypothetical protein ACYTG6_13660 [Planctomycetota bacterium]|jgi:hypothetical protein